MSIALRFENGTVPTLHLPLDLSDVEIVALTQDPEGYHLTVQSVVRHTACRQCGTQISQLHGYADPITLRHLAVFNHPLWITFRAPRFVCSQCSTPHHPVTTTQSVDWHTPRSPLTRAYEDHILRQLINSTIEDVRRKENLPYDTVLGVLERRIATTVDWTEFTELEILGIDEIARRKGHRDFLAIITARTPTGDTRLLAVLPNRDKITVKAFLDTIPARLRRTLRTICTDMWDGYVNAVRESLLADPDCHAELVIDRFHVAQHYHQAVDALRKEELKRLQRELPAAEYQELRGTLWLFRQRRDTLTPDEQTRLECLLARTPRLRQAYDFREQLTRLFDSPLTVSEARTKLQAWRQAVQASELHCFKAFLTTLENWFDEILNYFHHRQTSGFVEGFNNKVKVLKRRCYGLLNVTHFFQRLYLDLEGYQSFA